jgi:hypothetical protein
VVVKASGAVLFMALALKGEVLVAVVALALFHPLRKEAIPWRGSAALTRPLAPNSADCILSRAFCLYF